MTLIPREDHNQGPRDAGAGLGKIVVRLFYSILISISISQDYAISILILILMLKSNLAHAYTECCGEDWGRQPGADGQDRGGQPRGDRKDRGRLLGVWII